ncbi:MAG: hypothetical protein AAF441_01705 [Pseudomonadota bacterium]
MALALKNLAKLAIQKIASDPETRRKAVETARTVAEEAGNIVKEQDKARAAGKAFSRVMRNLNTASKD